MQFLESLTDRTPLFAADAGAGAVAKAFAKRPHACAFPVTDEHGAIDGLIERRAVEQALADGQAGRRIGSLQLRDPLALGGGLTAREAIVLVLAHPDHPEAFLVMNGEACLGVCTLRTLVQAVLADEAQSTEAQVTEAQATDAAGLDQRVAEEVQRLYGALEAECRAQVQGLMAMAERLERQPLGPDALAQVHSIRATGEALLRLAGDANDLMRARQGRLELALRPQSLRALIDRIQARWEARAAENGVNLLISYDGDPDLSALIDADRLTQVFDSLIDNALRYTRRGSIEVGLRARIEDDQVRLEGRVRDTGAELAAKLAEAFEADADGSDGLSLPLSLARGVMTSMDGTLRAETNAGQGATMLFRMLAEAAEEPAPAVDERPASSAAHVLVVDDNATNRMVAEALCEMFDCTSETAEDGMEAVEAARTGRFDLILMDIKMPRMDGIAAARAIRSLEGPEAMTPIVALTANVDPEDARSYMAAGMCCVVEKPIKPDRLLLAINTALAEAQSAAEDTGRIAAA
jgi:CheY-like chemotaxis protein/signal transduction histidine kinase